MYKQNLAASISLIPHPSPLTPTLVDLTGGFGVDFSYLARNFSKAIYVERQEHLCDIARNNFLVLGLNQAEVICSEAEQFIESMSRVSMIYLDPARRDINGARTFAIGDCTPDVVALRDILIEKADRVMLKLSPMLDWRKAVGDLGEENVSEVHVVSVNNECKELLVIMTAEKTAEVKVVGVDIEVRGEKGEVRDYFEGRWKRVEGRDYLTSHPSPLTPHLSPLTPNIFLYEPNASIMKIGCFEELERRFGVCQVAKNSHLFLSDHEVDDFPGRSFNIVATTTMNKRELKAALADVTSANIAVRNFPLSAVELRKRLKLKDGGDTYIFATTDADNQHKLYICSKTKEKAVKE